MENFEVERIPREHNFKSKEGWMEAFTFWKTNYILVCVCVYVYLRLKNKGSHCSTWALKIAYFGSEEGICSVNFLNPI